MHQDSSNGVLCGGQRTVGVWVYSIYVIVTITTRSFKSLLSARDNEQLSRQLLTVTPCYFLNQLPGVYPKEIFFGRGNFSNVLSTLLLDF